MSRWWLVLPTLLMTVGVTVVSTLAQPKVYEAYATYVVKPADDFQDDVLSALSIVSRQPEIAETYSQLASSRRVRKEVAADLQLSVDQQSDIKLESRLVPGSNILRLTVRATDANLARDYSNALGTIVVAYLNDLYNAFELVEVDSAETPGAPVQPVVPLNIALGTIVGLLLASGLAFVAEMLTPAPRVAAQLDIMDRDSGTYNHAFFTLRLRQEISRTRRTGMSRTRRAGSTLALAVINVNHRETLSGLSPRLRTDSVRRIVQLLERHVRVEDVVARIDEFTFGLLLPDTTEADAVTIVEALRGRLALPVVASTDGGEPIRIYPAAGIASYRGGATSDAELIAGARRALDDAETVAAGKTAALSSARTPTGQ